MRIQNERADKINIGSSFFLIIGRISIKAAVPPIRIEIK
jgi:hypothetical protein